MEILADRDITQVEAAFAPFGQVRLFSGRELDAGMLGHAEVLLVRSVTPVTADLIRHSRLRFVGTATAGVDHIDTRALQAAGIAFSDAPGCNARAVAEHVIACVYRYAALRAHPLRELAVGIIGHGHAGRALSALCDRLQIAWCAHDPPRAAAESDYRSAALASVIAQDVVSVHVPLTAAGQWPTQDLLGPDIIDALRPATLVVNAARGGIVDEHALAARSVGPARLYAALDCWAREPLLDAAVLERTWLATPHLAGQSLEARTNATAMLVAALAKWQGVREPPPLAAPPRLDAELGNGIGSLLERVHPLAVHDRALRALGTAPRARQATTFDALRRAGLRREFSAYRIACAGVGSDTVAELAALGFVPDPTPANSTPP